MKGLEAAVALVFSLSLALGNPPLEEPVQYEQFCNDLKVAGSGNVDMSASAIDKRIALDYSSILSGEGNLEMDMERVLSESARNLTRDVSSINETGPSNLNLFESSKVTYSGATPLVGEKYVRSKAFYGGIGASIQESFNVKEMVRDETSYFGSTATASGAHLMGTDTEGSFNGTWGTDTTWHRTFYKNIESRQSLTGRFEVQKGIKVHERATYTPCLICSRTPCNAEVRAGDVVNYEYKVVNEGQTVVSGLTLIDGDLGKVPLTRTTLGPGDAATGKASYRVTEEDVLKGPREVIITARGYDNLKEVEETVCKSWLIPKAFYYSGNAFAAPSCPPCPDGKVCSEQGCARCVVGPDAFDLTGGTLTIYALGVNMTQSRFPGPTCPYTGWPSPLTSSLAQFGITNSTFAGKVSPPHSAWESLTLDPGYYAADQAYSGTSQVQGSILNWKTAYDGLSPNGGFACTGDPAYDTFDMKMALKDLGPGRGFRAEAYQRVYKSTDPSEIAGEWRLLGSQDVPEIALDKTALKPFVLVGNLNSTQVGGTISWSRVVVAL